LVLTPIKAIRKKCLECSGESHKEVRLCPITDCSLYPYRFGKRPETTAKHDEKEKTKKGTGEPPEPKYKRKEKRKNNGK